VHAIARVTVYKVENCRSFYFVAYAAYFVLYKMDIYDVIGRTEIFYKSVRFEPNLTSCNEKELLNLTTLFSDTVYICTSVNVRDQVSQPYKITKYFILDDFR
jgi:hypothetical protein